MFYGRKSYRREYKRHGSGDDESAEEEGYGSGGEKKGYGSGDESYADKAKRAAMKNQYIADNSGYGSGEDSLREAKEAAKRQYMADQAKSEAKEAAKRQYIADQAKAEAMEKQNIADQAKAEAIKNQYIADQAKTEAAAAMKNQYIKPDENPYVKPDETVVTPVLDTTPGYTPPVYTPPVYTMANDVRVQTPPIILDKPFYVVYMTPLLILLVAIIVGIILFFVFKSKNRHSANNFISAFGKLW